MSLYFDGDISAADVAELDACLKVDPDARALFLSHADAHALLRAFGARKAGMPQWRAAERNRRPGKVFRFAAASLRHPWLAAAAGLVIGIAVGSSGLISQKPTGGFLGRRYASGREEVPQAPVQTPELPDRPHPVLVTEVACGLNGWEGSFKEAVGTERAERGTGEFSAHMFRMVAREVVPGEGRSEKSGYLRGLIDLRPYREGFSDGKASIQLSGLLNTVGGAQTQGEFCSIAMYALDESTLAKSTLPSGDIKEDALVVAKKEIRLIDRDPVTWERVSAELNLPPTADYLVVRIDVGGDGGAALRYLDDIRLDLARNEPLH